MRPNSHVRGYLQQAQRNAHQNTMSANGRGERTMGADGWLRNPAPSRQFTADAESGQFFPATGPAGGGNGGGQQSYSQPYIIQVSNASAATVSDFDLWGAIIYSQQPAYPFNADGSQTRGAITLSTTYPSPVTYQTMLQQSNTGVFTVGWTHLEVLSGPNGQISLPWTLKTFDINSAFARRSLPNPTPGTQFQAGVKDNYTPYDIDGSTTLGMTILGSAVFLMYFYPVANINLSRSLLGQNSSRTFSPPPSNLTPQPVLITQ